MLARSDIVRLHYGFIVAPEGSRDGGQPIPVCGYLVRHPQGLLLFDTGFAPVDDETRQRYHPQGVTVREALRTVGANPSDVTVIVNCHLHADHAGGNAAFPRVPIIVQRAELAAARHGEYTVPTHTHEFQGARLKVVSGDTDLLPDVRILSAPGHSPGHQILATETDEGWVILAGQAFNSASEFGFASFSHRLSRGGLGRIGASPAWMRAVADLNPRMIYFAHDLATFVRDEAILGTPIPL